MSKKNEKTDLHGSITPRVRIKDSEFEAQVLQSQLPVLVAFQALWSRPCQAFDVVLDQLAQSLAGKVKMVEVDADDCLELSLYFDIQSVPQLLCFIGGKLRMRIVGTATKEAILAKLKTLSLSTD